jgi:hypothetical protein
MGNKSGLCIVIFLPSAPHPLRPFTSFSLELETYAVGKRLKSNGSVLLPVSSEKGTRFG